jgi:hypothetical protein
MIARIWHGSTSRENGPVSETEPLLNRMDERSQHYRSCRLAN